RSVGGAAAAAPVPSAMPAPSVPAPSSRARREGAATGSKDGAGRRVRPVGSIDLPLSGALDSETSAPSSARQPRVNNNKNPQAASFPEGSRIQPWSYQPNGKV